MNVAAVIGTAVSGLGFELVDVEHASGGMLRVFIDKPAPASGERAPVTVDDCAVVSNHLSRLLVVENIDYSRLEVSSPGLDRPLKSLEAFQRFIGSPVRVRLSEMVDGRKRFDGVIEQVEGSRIGFRLFDDSAADKATGKRQQSRKQVAAVVGETRLATEFRNIERARLIPEI